MLVRSVGFLCRGLSTPRLERLVARLEHVDAVDDCLGEIVDVLCIHGGHAVVDLMRSMVPGESKFIGPLVESLIDFMLLLQLLERFCEVANLGYSGTSRRRRTFAACHNAKPS